MNEGAVSRVYGRVGIWKKGSLLDASGRVNIVVVLRVCICHLEYGFLLSVSQTFKNRDLELPLLYVNERGWELLGEHRLKRKEYLKRHERPVSPGAEGGVVASETCLLSLFCLMKRVFSCKLREIFVQIHSAVAMGG